MAARYLLSIVLLLAGLVASTPAPQRIRRQDATTTTSGDAPVNITCGDIIDAVNEGNMYFYASDAFECLSSVPFNDAVALRFIDYYNTTLQFQSTLAYLKNPPTGYQQPAVDLVAGLEDIKNNVTAGAYKNQYAFEAELLRLVYSAHDAHVDLYAGIMSTFSFASQWDIVSASADGTSTPEIYIADDVVQHQDGYQISPVTLINGENATVYLERFAALNSVGMLEPHADWNQLMYSPVQNVVGDYTIFSGGATFYEGDWLNYTFANGSTLDTPWVAIYTYTEFTGPLTTGGDYYNYFVLGLVPASYDNVTVPNGWSGNYDTNDSVSATYTYDHGWDNITGGEYPRADVMQDDLEGSGYVTGYYLEDISTAVLSIPTFDESGWAIGNFSTTVNDFLEGAQNRSLTKLIVDLQGNWGGTPLLAFTTFRSIFPGINPFAGSRRRSHDLANVVGSTKTTYWSSLSDTVENQEDLKQYLSADEWVIIDRLNAKTGKNFTSWAEYFGPQEENGDLFSLVEQYDLANENFDFAAFDGWAPTGYLAGYDDENPEVFKVEDVVVLTDATCSSTCALFVEMMTHQAGARTIVVGGQPRTGPMQAASGSRGAAAYDSYLLDVDFQETISYDANTTSQLPSRDTPGMYISYAGFNLRDQVRTADAPVGPPLQFTYLAADCRLWFTLDNVLNLTTLWHDVATAAWTDSSRCVAGSTGYAASAANSTSTAKAPPASSATALPELPAVYYGEDFEAPAGTNDTSGSLHDDQRAASVSAPVVLCNTQSPVCTGGRTCQPIQIGCATGLTKTVNACVRGCIKGQTQCGGDATYCKPTTFVESSSSESNLGLKLKGGIASRLVQRGYCVPTQGTKALGCPA